MRHANYVNVPHSTVLLIARKNRFALIRFVKKKKNVVYYDYCIRESRSGVKMFRLAVAILNIDYTYYMYICSMKNRMYEVSR